jgi:hypothetical protein
METRRDVILQAAVLADDLGYEVFSVSDLPIASGDRSVLGSPVRETCTPGSDPGAAR